MTELHETNAKPVSFVLSFEALAEGDCIDMTSLRVEPINIILVPDDTLASLNVDSSFKIPAMIKNSVTNFIKN